MENKLAVLGLKYQCARFEGDVKSLQLANHRIEKQLAELLERKSMNDHEIAKIRSQVKDVEKAAKLSFDVDLTNTAARQTWQKAAYSGWGAVTRQILTQLRLANGLPLSTRDIADDLNHIFELNYEEPEIFKLRTAVRDAVKRFYRKGLVRKISGPTKLNIYSTWVIADPAE